MAGTNPAATIAETTCPPSSRDSADGEHRLDRLGLLEYAQHSRRDYPQGPLATHEDPGQVQAGEVEASAPQPDDLTVGQHHLDPQHMVGRHPVFEAVRPTRVLGDVAPQGAGLLTGGIGGVVIPERREGGRDVEVEDARLDQNALIGEIDLQDLVHAAHLQDHRAFERDGSPAEIGAASAGYDPDPLPGQQLHHRRDLGRGVDEHHSQGQGAFQIGVVLVGQKIDHAVEHIPLPYDGP